MSLKTAFISIRDNYVINQVEKVKLPEFPEDKVRRYSIIFSGRVQHVGFRLEICELAKKLQLTGYCQNLENGDVLVEVQGPKNRIKYMVSFMESLKRIRIRNRTMNRMDLDTNEKEFIKK